MTEVFEPEPLNSAGEVLSAETESGAPARLRPRTARMTIVGSFRTSSHARFAE